MFVRKFGILTLICVFGFSLLSACDGSLPDAAAPTATLVVTSNPSGSESGAQSTATDNPGLPTIAPAQTVLPQKTPVPPTRAVEHTKTVPNKVDAPTPTVANTPSDDSATAMPDDSDMSTPTDDPDMLPSDTPNPDATTPEPAATIPPSKRSDGSTAASAIYQKLIDAQDSVKSYKITLKNQGEGLTMNSVVVLPDRYSMTISALGQKQYLTFIGSKMYVSQDGKTWEESGEPLPIDSPEVKKQLAQSIGEGDSFTSLPDSTFNGKPVGVLFVDGSTATDPEIAKLQGKTTIYYDKQTYLIVGMKIVSKSDSDPDKTESSEMSVSAYNDPNNKVDVPQ